MDITTKYLGLTLKNPVVVSPSPLSENLANIRKMEDAGAGAVVLHSLFEEQIRLESETLDRNISMSEERYAEHPSFFPDLENYKLGPEAYVDLDYSTEVTSYYYYSVHSILNFKYYKGFVTNHKSTSKL